VVDAAMIDASANMMTMFSGMLKSGQWTEQRGTNVLDGGAPFYRCYETRDGGYVAVGAIESKFFVELLRLLELPSSLAGHQYDRASWPDMESALETAIKSKTRDEWAEAFADAETCLSPVLSLSEAADDPHNKSRGVFIEIDGVRQPAPAPRLSRTPGAVQGAPQLPGENSVAALKDWGIDSTRIMSLLHGRVLHDRSVTDCSSAKRATSES